MHHSLESLMKMPALSSERPLGRLVRYPLKLVPPMMAVPIMMGKLRGKRWIAGSGIYRCWLGLYEYEKQQLVAREVRPNTVFYDVGANVGFYTLLASRLVGAGKVFAFEPVPKNIAYLRHHLTLNRVTNAEIFPLAVGDQNGMVSFSIEQTGLMGHLSDEGGVTVPIVTLDSLVVEGKILPPDYIKMDIEGAELLALRGASRTFQRYHPVLFLATHGREVHTQCIQLLQSWGYSCSSIDHGDSGELGELIARFDS